MLRAALVRACNQGGEQHSSPPLKPVKRIKLGIRQTYHVSLFIFSNTIRALLLISQKAF
jgi:hypothetical protein